MTSEIIWTGSPDDQTAIVGNYMLEMKDEPFREYQWKVSCHFEEVASGSHFNFQEAKTACEKAYYEHLKTNQNGRTD